MISPTFVFLVLFVESIRGYLNCPVVFHQYKKQLSSVFSSSLSKRIENSCHACIVEKAKILGIKSSTHASEWSCIELLLAITKSPLGCSTVCLQQSLDQCFFHQNPPKDLVLTRSCSSCLSNTDNCPLDCKRACTLPSGCDTTKTSSCSNCLSQQNDTFPSHCLIPISKNGCREFCVGNCGDGRLAPTEECDDSNTSNGDGCSSTCQVEDGYTCHLERWNQSSQCHPICGDGQIHGKESCDDGNKIDADGCSSTCQVEEGYDCTTGICHPICGDGLVVGTEQCDDSGTIDHDGCSSVCEIEPYWTCTLTKCSPICGDSVRMGNETCDDGNTIDFDGCSKTCQVEDGFNCSKTCLPICGDGLTRGLEECDDLNTINGDGCSSSCHLEPGFQCTNDGTNCSAICGDGIVSTPYEECDDFNDVPGDGCSSICGIETGFSCFNTSCHPICGDGLVMGNETCDVLSDGCDASCQVERGYKCTSNPNTCSTICGDGIVLKPEECDDQNTRDFDGCSSTCTVEPGYTCSESSKCTPVCGDGIVTRSEECDTPMVGCSDTCTLEKGFACDLEPCTSVSPICGDGFLAQGEECDDSNKINGDGCSDICRAEKGFTCFESGCVTVCGDGIRVGSEECDDHNTENHDGCSSTCTIESTLTPQVTRWNCREAGKPCEMECAAPRIRKPWDALTTTEQETYVSAIEVAMERGLYAIFVGIHYEAANERQAHATCGFLGWHRKYLLAFENMLRSLGPDYVCVTIPYWDYFAEYVRFTSGECRSISRCASITRGLGGSDGPFQTVNIPGSGGVGGQCSRGRPNQNACPLATGSSGSASCSNCMPRGDWGTSMFPPGLGYGSISSLLSGGRGYAVLTEQVQRGFHNTVHSTLEGIMGTLASPADPIFFSHHCTIDLAYQLHHKCHFGRRLSDQEKQTDRNAFEGCGSPTSFSHVRMDVYSPQQRRLMDPHQYNITALFFRDLPRRYWEYVDSTDIAPGISYNYQVDDLITALLQSGMSCRNPEYIFMQEHGGLYTQHSALDQGQSNYYNWFQETCARARENLGEPYTHRRDQDLKILEQLEYIECLNYERMYGRCNDYTPLFKESFHVQYKSRCREIIDDIREGKRKVLVPNWQHTCNRYFNS